MKRLVYISLLLLPLFLKGQDLHFSQFFASPLTLNPARTGMFEGDFRVGGNFKNQWRWANAFENYNYRTFSLYGDMSFLQGVLPKADKIGVGAVILHDRAGDGNLGITKVFLSAAYHKTLGNDNKYMLSFGWQGGYVQKNIDYDRLFFDNQWDDNFFNTQLGTGEPTDGDMLNYFDMGLGVTFTYKIRLDRVISFGVATMHVTKPKESFYEGELGENRLGVRPILNSQGYFKLKKNWSVEPSIAWMYQKKAMEAVISGLVGYQFYNQDKPVSSKIFFGASYRTMDALIPVIGYQYSSVRVLFNYDVNLSRLTEASNGLGGFEMSIVYVGERPGSIKRRAVPCPRL